MKNTETEITPVRKRRRVSLALKLNILIIAAIIGIAFGLVLIAFFLNSRQVRNMYLNQLDRVARMCRMAVFEEDADWLMEVLCSDEFLALKKQAEEQEDPEILIEWMQSRTALYGDDIADYNMFEQWSMMCSVLNEICEKFGIESTEVRCLYNDRPFILINTDMDPLRLGPVETPGGSYYVVEERSGRKVTLLAAAEKTMYISEIPLAENAEIGNASSWFHIALDITRVSDETRWFLMNCLIFLLLFVAIVIPVSVFVIRGIAIKPLRLLQKGSDRFSEGEDGYTLDKVVRMNRKANDEISDLYRGIRAMQTRIVHDIENTTRITAEKERIDTELELAAKIQRSALPERDDEYTGRPEFSLCASMDPAKDVGGDFYDFFYQDQDHLALVIADVSDKGIPAALFMMSAKNLIKNQTMAGGTPAEILAAVNAQLAKNNKARMFVTVWLGILDLITGVLTASSAGHEEPFIRRNGESFAILHDKHGFVLGGLARSKYTDYEIVMHCGDTIFLYTDGVPEAACAPGEFFGLERLAEALNDPEAAGPEEILRVVEDNVSGFVKGAEQFDDLTMLCLTYHGSMTGKQE